MYHSCLHESLWINFIEYVLLYYIWRRKVAFDGVSTLFYSSGPIWSISHGHRTLLIQMAILKLDQIDYTIIFAINLTICYIKIHIWNP